MGHKGNKKSRRPASGPRSPTFPGRPGEQGLVDEETGAGPDQDAGALRGDGGLDGGTSGSIDEVEPSAPSATVMVLETLAVFVIFACVMGKLQWISQYVVGVDAYFHQKMALLMRERWGAVQSFPWAQASTFRDGFSDSSCLYHLLLIPFTFITDDVTAIKAGAVVFSAAIFATMYWVLRTNRCHVPMFFVVLLASCGSLLMYRFCQNRGYLLSIVLCLLAVEALIGRRHRLLFVVSVLYPLSYTAFQIVLVLVVLKGVAHWINGESIDQRSVVIVVAGLLLGHLIHPNFPRNFSMWWIQNIRVMFIKWFGNVNLFFGGELYPPELRTLLHSTTTLLIVGLLTTFAALVTTRRRSTETIFVFMATAFFGLMTLMSKRFIEYTAPLGLTFAALLMRDLVTEDDARKWMWRSPLKFWTVVWLAFGLQTALLYRSYEETKRDLVIESEPNLKDTALWLKNNARPGDIVYTADWDDFPQLFYYNDLSRYLVCLDPAFFYEFNPKLWQLWFDVSNVKISDVYAPVRYRFGARYLLVAGGFDALFRKCKADSRFKLVQSRSGVALFQLLDDHDFVRHWALSGPYGATSGPVEAMDARLLEQLAKGPKKADLGSFQPFQRFRDEDWGGFVDLERSLLASEECWAYAVCRVSSPTRQTADLLFGHDDGFALWLDGKSVYSSGAASELAVDQRRASVELKPGFQWLVARCSNQKRAWAFCLRFSGLKDEVQVDVGIPAIADGRAQVTPRPTMQPVVPATTSIGTQAPK